MTRQLDTEAPAELFDGGLADRIRDGTRPVDVGESKLTTTICPRLRSPNPSWPTPCLRLCSR